MSKTTATLLVAGIGLAGCDGPSPMQRCARGEPAACARVQGALEVSFGADAADGRRVRLMAERTVQMLRTAPDLAPSAAECRRGARAACDRLVWAAAALMMDSDASWQGRLGRAMARGMSGGILVVSR